MHLEEFNRQMELFASRTSGIGQTEGIACTFCGMHGHEIWGCHLRGELSNDGGQAQAPNSYNSWPMHEPCGDFDNPGSSYERCADSYEPNWRRDQDTQANAYVRSQEETLNDFIQSAQAFQQRSQAYIQANEQG